MKMGPMLRKYSPRAQTDAPGRAQPAPLSG
jgi:hypothetical protein